MQLRSLAEIRQSPYPKPRPLIQGLLNQGELVMLTGSWDSFKSRISAEIVRAVVTGDDFLGRFPTASPGPALIIQQEINKGAYDERIIAMADGVPDSAPLFLYDGEQFRFEPGYDDELASVIKERDIRLVIFDPLTYFWPQDRFFDENNNTAVANVLAPLLKLRETGCTFILVHHDPKPSNGFEGVARGASHLVNAPDARILLKRPVDSDEVTIKFKTRNINPPGKFKAVLDPVTGRLWYKDSQPVGRPTDPRKIEVLEMSKSGKTQAQIVHDTGLSQSTVWRYLNEKH
jgi:hypothetical protein